MKKATSWKILALAASLFVVTVIALFLVPSIMEDEEDLPDVVGHWIVVQTGTNIFFSEEGMFVAALDPNWVTGYRLYKNGQHPQCREAAKRTLHGEGYDYCILIFSEDNAAYLFSMRGDSRMVGKLSDDGEGRPLPWELTYIDSEEEPW